MKFAFRWYGPEDPVTLQQIRQIPVVTTIVSACYEFSAGEEWASENIAARRHQVAEQGLWFEVAEGVPVHESIKLGHPERDRYIENYIRTLEKLSEQGIKTVCYNFMPVFGWIRTQLDKQLSDGSQTVAFYQNQLEAMDPTKDELALPGWNFSSGKDELGRLLQEYSQLGTDGMWKNLTYFLEAVVPAAESFGIKIAIHPDDPPLPVFGLPRIVSSEQDLARITRIVDSPSNGITLCTGSLGSGRQNDVCRIAERFAAEGKIHFVHARNVGFENELDFVETAHPSACGNLDMAAILKALHKGGFQGYLRADHGRMVWGETGKVGYGLYDRAMGITYLAGLWEAITKYT
ncbi:MAG: mannonate dehydratase [Angelakisella sp.]